MLPNCLKVLRISSSGTDHVAEVWPLEHTCQRTNCIHACMTAHMYTHFNTPICTLEHMPTHTSIQHTHTCTCKCSHTHTNIVLIWGKKTTLSLAAVFCDQTILSEVVKERELSDQGYPDMYSKCCCLWMARSVRKTAWSRQTMRSSHPQLLTCLQLWRDSLTTLVRGKK